MPPKKPVPKAKRKVLHLPKARRIEWAQDIWNKIAKKFAEIQIRYEQGGGKAPGFKTMMGEAMTSLLPESLHRPNLTGFAQCPAYFEGLVKDARRTLLTMPSQPAPAAPAPEAERAANESQPPSELEGIEELLKRTAENQERLEAKMEDGRRYQENLYLVLEAVLTAPSGQNPEAVLKQPEVMAAIKAMEKPEVIVAGIPPKHEERLMRQYGSRMKLRVFPVGGTRKLQEVNALNRVEHIVCASEVHGAGLERVMKERGYKKHLLRAGGMTDVRRTLDTILSNPESLYQQQHP